VHHRGLGRAHFDLIIGYGRHCPTVRVELVRNAVRVAWSAPHRRHYLSYRGPVSGGRGVVAPRWYGQVRWTRASLEMGSFKLHLKRLSVVPVVRLQTLLRP
jgi:predicted esterase